MVVYFVLQSHLAGLVEAFELVEVDRISIRHQHAMKDHCHTTLLPKAGGTDFSGLPQNDRTLGDEHVLHVMGVDRIRHQYFDGPDSVTIESIHEDAIDGGAFTQ